MNAIKLLKQQHREVEALWKKFEKEKDDGAKEALFERIADDLAIHAGIEEKYFYPAVRDRQTKDQLEEAYDEHLDIKKLILDAMDGTDNPGFDGLVAALMGAVQHHVEEEEEELFPTVQKLITKEALEALGETMEAEVEVLRGAGDARMTVQIKSEQPAIQI